MGGLLSFASIVTNNWFDSVNLNNINELESVATFSMKCKKIISEINQLRLQAAVKF